MTFKTGFNCYFIDCIERSMQGENGFSLSQRMCRTNVIVFCFVNDPGSSGSDDQLVSCFEFTFLN